MARNNGSNSLGQSLTKSDIEKGIPLTLGVKQFKSMSRANSDNGSVASTSSSKIRERFTFQNASNWVIISLIIVLGMATSAAFMAVGISSASADVHEQFEIASTDIVNKVQGAWEDYVNAAKMIHGFCQARNFTRREFRELYEYLVSSGLDFQGAQFNPNITLEERPAAEAEARAFYAEYYPYIEYRGFVGFETDDPDAKMEPRSDAPFYFPIHYMEPIPGNEAAIDLDRHTSIPRRSAVQKTIGTGLPVLTDRLNLVQEIGNSFGVVLMHPGINLTDTYEAAATSAAAHVWPKDYASIVIRIPALLKRSTLKQTESSRVYLYDSAARSTLDGGPPVFLGAVEVHVNHQGEPHQLTDLPEKPLSELSQGTKHYRQQDIPAADKTWTVAVVAIPGTYQPNFLFVVLGGVVILVASLCLAFWITNNARRIARFNLMRSQADAEKAALILDNARQATKAERELNDFIAHEVRNPVAAAMSACSFVKTAVHKAEPLRDAESIENARDDVDIIENSLQFVNDLLRNMLDMHRATNKQLKVNMTPTDILYDVLEPVGAMLLKRGDKIKLQIECPDNLIAMADRLRLKQVILNLGRNSVKFIEQGFIRLRAQVLDDDVHVSVEDSGPGIPQEKRSRLFNKFQESLDVLSQGTGVGLFLCKNLVELMDGEIRLDEDYDSGLQGFPGSRFVVILKIPSMDVHSHRHLTEQLEGDTKETAEADSDDSSFKELPEVFDVLFVDDDPILRKLFTRTIKTVAPNWNVRQAANGETALRLTDDISFDLIFMDMYMAAVQKQMLGTETVEALRAKGVTSRICGLSANDKEKEFLAAGADAFTFKPFPCESRALTQELCRILFNAADHGSQSHTNDDQHDMTGDTGAAGSAVTFAM